MDPAPAYILPPPDMEEDLQGPGQINIIPATPPHMEQEQLRILQGFFYLVSSETSLKVSTFC